MNTVSKWTLYLGLNDKDDKKQHFTTAEAYKVVSNEITNGGFDGGTIYEARGVYKHESGEIVTENTLRIEVLFATQAQIRVFVNKLKVDFNQESIAVQHEEVISELW